MGQFARRWRMFRLLLRNSKETSVWYCQVTTKRFIASGRIFAIKMGENFRRMGPRMVTDHEHRTETPADNQVRTSSVIAREGLPKGRSLWPVGMLVRATEGVVAHFLKYSTLQYLSFHAWQINYNHKSLWCTVLIKYKVYKVTCCMRQPNRYWLMQIMNVLMPDWPINELRVALGQ